MWFVLFNLNFRTSVQALWIKAVPTCNRPDWLFYTCFYVEWSHANYFVTELRSTNSKKDTRNNQTLQSCQVNNESTVNQWDIVEEHT